MKTLLSRLQTLPTWQFLLLYLGSMLLIKCILGLQGFDMCDEGWVLSAYQQIFDCPSSCEYQFLYYNTIVIGGVWNKLFGAWGIYGFRVFNAICCTALAYVVYLLLKDSVNRWAIFIGVLVFNLGYVLVFHQNVITALLCTIGCLFLYKGLMQKSSFMMLLAGVVVGINFFTRLPNVSMLSLSLTLIPYYLYNRDLKNTLLMLLWAGIGIIVGCTIEVLMMINLNHFDLFIDNLSSGTSAATAGDSTHSLSNILRVYGSNYATVRKQVGLLVSFPVILYFFEKLNKTQWLNKIVFVVGGLLYAAFLWKKCELTFFIYGFSYLVFAIYALRFYSDKATIYLISIASCVLFFLPFGSDYGIGNMGPNCIWIATPLTVGLAWKMLRQVNNSTQHKIILTTLVTCLVVVSTHELYRSSLNCYFDSGSRLKKTSLINNPLATTFTTEEKCEKANIMLNELSKYVKKGDYLLCFQCIPMVNYLTETRPYLGNSWVWAYDSSNLEYQFEKAQKNIDDLPVVIWNKSGIASWQSHADDWNSLESNDQWNFNSRKIELMQDFIQKNNYEIVWENDLFQILLPELVIDKE